MITEFSYMTIAERKIIIVENPDYVSLYTFNGFVCLVYSKDGREVSVENVIKFEEISRRESV